MLVESNGMWTGGISGGCLEGDALKRSQLAIYKKQISTVIYDTMDDDANQIGVGLGCNGTIKVLFLPIDYQDNNNPIEQLRKIVKQDKEQILIQVIDSPEEDRLVGQNILSDKIDIVSDNTIKIVSTVSVSGKTGVEMEALVGANVAALTIYDMCKGFSHNIIIKESKLLEKTGGKSDFKRN